jgi:hypothetical protein
LWQKSTNFSQPACQGYLSFLQLYFASARPVRNLRYLFRSHSLFEISNGARVAEAHMSSYNSAGMDLFVREYRPISADVFAADVAATARADPPKPRHWRTRKDPFEAVRYDVLCWLQGEPDATAKAMFDRLQREHPELLPDGQLRTLQRRIREWRQIMAKKAEIEVVDTVSVL